MGFTSCTPTTMRLAMVRAVCGGVQKGIKGKGKGPARPQGTQAPQPGIPIYARIRHGILQACYHNSNGRLAAFSSSGSEDESVAVAEEEPDSDDCDPLPPLPHEQAGLPSRVSGNQ